MRVFERIGRILRADAHGVMDQWEERTLVLRQHLREAEVEVTRKRVALESLDEERRRVREEGERLEARVAELDGDVELARMGEDADLVRFAVRRLLPKQTALRELFARARELDARRTRASEKLEVQVRQLEELRPRVRAHLERHASRVPPFETEYATTEEEVEIEILRRQRGDREASAGEGAR